MHGRIQREGPYPPLGKSQVAKVRTPSKPWVQLLLPGGLATRLYNFFHAQLNFHAEQEIYPAHNVKMPTSVDILTFISMTNTISERLKANNSFICWYFSFNAFSADLSMKFFITLDLYCLLWNTSMTKKATRKSCQNPHPDGFLF